MASQGFDQIGFLSAITKATLAVPDAPTLPDLVRAAFRIATSGRPGPVAVVIPHNVLDAEWAGGDGDLDVDDRTARAPAFRTVADPASIGQAATLLSAAARPMIIAGGGVHTSRAAAELATLAGRIDAVVVTSFTGKGAIDPGQDADLVVFAPDETFTVDPARLYHRHKLTPYAGQQLQGVVRRVWLRGRPLAPTSLSAVPAGRLLTR